MCRRYRARAGAENTLTSSSKHQRLGIVGLMMANKLEDSNLTCWLPETPAGTTPATRSRLLAEQPPPLARRHYATVQISLGEIVEGPRDDHVDGDREEQGWPDSAHLSRQGGSTSRFLPKAGLTVVLPSQGISGVPIKSMLASCVNKTSSRRIPTTDAAVATG